MTFDLWQTLLMDNPEQGRARMQVRLDGAVAALAKAGRDFDPEHVREAYRACYRTCHAIREEERDVSFEQQVAFFIGHIEDGLLEKLPENTVTEITAAYCDSFYAFPPRVHEEADETLRQVKADGYKVGVDIKYGHDAGLRVPRLPQGEGLGPLFRRDGVLRRDAPCQAVSPHVRAHLEGLGSRA